MPTELQASRTGREHHRRRRRAGARQARRHDCEGPAGHRARDRQGDHRGALVGRRRRQGVQVKPGDKIKVGQTILTVDGAGASREAGGRGEAGGDAAKAKPQRRGGRRAAAGRAEAPTEHRGDRGRRTQASEPRRRQADSRERAPRPAAEDEVEEHPPKRGEVVDISRAPRTRRSRGGATAAASAGAAPPAAPSVRRIARELGVDIRQVNGTGPAGASPWTTCRASCARRWLGGGRPAPAAARPRPRAQQPLPDFSKFGDVERKPLSNIRRKTAEHLGHAWNVIPHVTHHDKADITELEELRKKYAAAGRARRRQADRHRRSR